MDYKKNLKYFRKPKLKFDVFLIIVGFFSAFFTHGLGAILLLLGVYLIVRQYTGRSTDAEMDAQLNGVLDTMVDTAKLKLNLDDDQIQMVDPLLVSGYQMVNGALTKKGKDGLMRSSVGGGLVFFFDENSIHTYTMNFSLIKPEQSQETGFASYKEVEHVTSNTSTQNIKNESVSMETLNIDIHGGKSMQITLPQSPDTVRSMNGAIQLIRERKSQS